MAESYSPDADRAFPDAPADLPQWLVILLARIIAFLRAHAFAARRRRSFSAPARCHDRPDLPPGPAQALAASVRGLSRRAIGWMCRRRRIGPGHRGWLERARAIVAFGSSQPGFRPGMRACGLQFQQDIAIVPGMTGMPKPALAFDAMALPLSRQDDFGGPPPAPTVASAASCPTTIRKSTVAEWRPTAAITAASGRVFRPVPIRTMAGFGRTSR